MASAKIIAILRARGAQFTDEELAAMPDAEGWNWLYRHFPPKNPRPRAEAGTIEICFTGFDDAQRDELIAQAKAAGMCVRTAVTQKLNFLCTGANAGPSKLAKAAAQKVPLLTLDQFQEMLGTGALPDDAAAPPSAPTTEAALRDRIIEMGRNLPA